jgi:molybdate transport system regulatory protein
MNSFEGHIDKVESSGNLSIITVKLHNDSLIKAILIDSKSITALWGIGIKIKALFKETEVVLSGPEMPNISIDNIWKGDISKIEKGDLLSRLEIESEIGLVTVLIPSKAITNMGLGINSKVHVMVKLNEVILSK